MKRKSISKKIRFNVFKRDGFKCQYCGSTPPNSVLELDHINPVSKGGENDIDNLITACFDCNRGKSNSLLTSLPKTVIEKSELIIEKEEQLKRFNSLNKSIKTRLTKQTNKISDVYTDYFPEWELNLKAKASIKNQFLKKLPVDTLIENMETACGRCNENDAFKYFCGICWTMIRENENG